MILLDPLRLSHTEASARKYVRFVDTMSKPGTVIEKNWGFGYSAKDLADYLSFEGNVHAEREGDAARY